MWLRRAASDLFYAENPMAHGGGEHDHTCWHAQQAAEKTMKSLLIYHVQPVPKTHDLGALRGRVPEDEEWGLPCDAVDMAWLSQWATASRYGEINDIHAQAREEDARRAQQLAQRIFHTVYRGMAARGHPPDIKFFHQLKPVPCCSGPPSASEDSALGSP